MNTEEFSFSLPRELIAQNPVFPRDSSRMICLDRVSEKIEHLHFRDIVRKLGSGDLLVFNESKVIPARLVFEFGKRKVEILLIRKINGNEWSVMVRPGRVFKPGMVIDIDQNLRVEILEIMDGGLRRVLFRMNSGVFDKYINKIGKTPFPPYIKNTSASADDYQTVYAGKEGSVAAPTAGLHFSGDVIKELQNKGVQTAFVTLHIGPGTFLPVKVENVDDHKMHSEWYEMDNQTAVFLNRAKESGRRIIAVGTTSVRVLESNFRSGQFHAETGETDIFIKPGYEWKCVDGLLTNFHLPKSTLMMLVCSFGGKEFIMDAYREAIAKKYRFFSFGDVMLIL